MAQAALRGLCGSFIGTRWRGMDEAENRVHRYVLQGYAATGRARRQGHRLLVRSALHSTRSPLRYGVLPGAIWSYSMMPVV
jgi:hypothetical protein